MSKKKISTGLGKGLGALLPSIEFDQDKGFKVTQKDEEETGRLLVMVDISKIHENPFQPRHEFDPQALEDLKNSILQHGIINPLTVRRDVQGYELIAGERRLRASIAAGLKKVPAYVLDIEHGFEMLELALIENIQREDLNPIEIAHGYKSLIDECRLTQEQVALKVGKERSTVANFLRLLKLPERIQEALRQRNISMGHARALLALQTNAQMMAAWKEVIDNKLSVRATEQLVKDIETGKVKLGSNGKDVKAKKPQQEKTPGDSEREAIINDIQDRLRHIFGTNVIIKVKSQESGSVEFEFYSSDDLDRLLELFDKAGR
jgi:ParB family chromosome partitioning protein